MTLKSGFFNSTDSGDTDHMYDASDFTEYLKGIISNGCIPADHGFEVVAVAPGVIPGSDAPSVVVKAGKAYFNGMWVVNTEDYTYSLGSGQQIANGMYHLLYFCFDTEARTVTIEHICNTNSSVVPGEDGTPVSGSVGNENKYFMPIAKTNDNKASQPDAVWDLRVGAGVVATNVGTGSLANEAVTSDKLGPKSVILGKVDDGAITGPNIVDKGVAFRNINGPTIMQYAYLPGDASVKAITRLGAGHFEVTVVPPIAGRLIISGYCQIDGTSLGGANPLVRIRTRKEVAGGAVTTITSVAHHSTKGEYFVIPFMAALDIAAGVSVKISIWGECPDEYVTVSAGSCFTTWLLPN